MEPEHSPKHHLWVTYTIVFLGFVGISIPYLIFPSLILNPEFSFISPTVTAGHRALFLGLTLSVYPLGQFLGSPILGSLSDAFGRKQLLSMSLLITALTYLLSGWAIITHSITILVCSRFITGFMEGNIAIARAMGADIKTLPKQKIFGKMNAFASIGYLIGPLLGALMADGNLSHLFRPSTPFFFIALLFFALSALSLRLLPTSPLTISFTTQQLWQRMNFIRGISTAFAHHRMKCLLIASTLFTLGIDIFYEFGPAYLTIKWSLSPTQLIVYNATLCLGLALGNGWLPTLITPRLPHRTSMTIAIGGFSLFVLGVAWTDSRFLMLLLFTTCGLAIGIAMTTFMVQISDAASVEAQGEILGVQHSLRVLGDGVICLLGGVLLAVSAKTLLFLATVIPVMAGLLYQRTVAKNS